MKMKSLFALPFILGMEVAAATAACPDKITGADAALTRTQFCDAFESLPNSAFALFRISIPKPAALDSMDAILRRTAEDLFSTYDLRNARDSVRLLPPSQGGPAGRPISVEYDSILMSKSTAMALSGETYILGLRAAFLPGSVSIPGWDCPDKIVNARPQQNGSPEARTDSVACALFNNQTDSQYALYNIRLQIPDSSVGSLSDSAQKARLYQISGDMFSDYDIRDYRDSARFSLPLTGIQAEYSIGYTFGPIIMTKTTAMALRSEPYIKTLAFDPKLVEVSVQPYGRSTHASSFTSHYGFDARGKIRRNPPRSEIRFHLPARH